MPPLLLITQKESNINFDDLDDESVDDLFRNGELKLAVRQVVSLKDGTSEVLKHTGEAWRIQELKKENNYEGIYTEILCYDKEKDEVVFAKDTDFELKNNLFSLSSKEFNNSKWRAEIVGIS